MGFNSPRDTNMPFTEFYTYRDACKMKDRAEETFRCIVSTNRNPDTVFLVGEYKPNSGEGMFLSFSKNISKVLSQLLDIFKM